jgi:LacI family transcriptional regulator
MSVTTKDIARKLGLSQPTVSRALNGSSDERVAPETRKRVEKAAREMGYRPNTLARSLRSGVPTRSASIVRNVCSTTVAGFPSTFGSQ